MSEWIQKTNLIYFSFSTKIVEFTVFVRFSAPHSFFLVVIQWSWRQELRSREGDTRKPLYTPLAIASGSYFFWFVQLVFWSHIALTFDMHLPDWVLFTKWTHLSHFYGSHVKTMSSNAYAKKKAIFLSILSRQRFSLFNFFFHSVKEKKNIEILFKAVLCERGNRSKADTRFVFYFFLLLLDVNSVRFNEHNTSIAQSIFRNGKHNAPLWRAELNFFFVYSKKERCERRKELN